jgi:hypothetical protein
VARDATARLYDVDEDSVVLNLKVGTITLRAKKGRLIDLDKLHESVKATRLGDGTGMALEWLDLTAVGKVVVSGREVRLKVKGSEQYFVLAEMPDSNSKSDVKTPFERLREALKRGEKVVRVTGRLDGWKGNWTQFLKKLPGKPRRILVKEFQTASK